MSTKHLILVVVISGLVVRVLGQGRWGGMGPGNGMGMMRGEGMGPGGGPNGQYMQVFQALLTANNQITRKVTQTRTGVETVTSSNDPAIARLIQKHVEQMRELMDGCAKGACPAQPRFWDPLFSAAYQNADKIKIQATATPNGVKVVESGTTEYARRLVQAHAAVVSSFVQNGHKEAMVAHPAPK